MSGWGHVRLPVLRINKLASLLRAVNIVMTISAKGILVNAGREACRLARLTFRVKAREHEECCKADGQGSPSAEQCCFQSGQNGPDLQQEKHMSSQQLKGYGLSSWHAKAGGGLE